MFYYMDLESINNLVSKPEYLALAIGGGIAVWPICKYVLYPIISGIFGDKVGYKIPIHTQEFVESTESNYSLAYKKVIEERSKLVLELMRNGKDGDEISDLVDNTLPFPDPDNF